MEIKKILNGSELTISLKGRLDSYTANDLENEINASINGVNSLIFDFANLDYISSAGLRIILTCQKIMNKQGKMEVINVNDLIMDVFEMTGFVDIISIK